jgi:hypothetical protein
MMNNKDLDQNHQTIMQTLKYAKFNINQDLASLAIVQVLEVEQTSDRLVNQKNNLFHLYLKNDQH